MSVGLVSSRPSITLAEATLAYAACGSMNGLEDANAASRGKQVQRYLEATTQIVTNWIEEGQSPDVPVAKYSSGHEARKENTLPELTRAGCSDAEIIKTMNEVVHGSVNPWTGRFVDKLYTAPLPLGVAAETLLAAINANAHVMSASPMLCLAEETCVAALAGLCGWDEDSSDGLTMPGGSSSNTLALQTALNSRFPAYQKEGIDAVLAYGTSLGRSEKGSRPLIYTSAEGHYSIDKAAIACGLGTKSVVKVPCDEYGQIDVRALENLLETAFNDIEGTKSSQPGLPIFVNATAGSTVMGAFDPIDQIYGVIERLHTSRSAMLRPWLHVDGSWGGPVIFSKLHRDRMRGIESCDSFTINPHKLLNVPLQCSFALFRNGEVLSANALDAPYLFHDTSKEVTRAANDAKHELEDSAKRAKILERKHKRRENPAQLNFGCGRRGDALKMYLLWLSKGGDYFAHLVDEGIERATQIVQHIRSQPELAERLEVAPLPLDKYFLQVCVRPCVKSIDGQQDIVTEAKSQATRSVHTYLRQRKRFAVDFAPLGRGQGDFIRIVTHPSTPLGTFIDLLQDIVRAGQAGA